jgi:hypothetical protein
MNLSTDQLWAKSIKTMVGCVVEGALANFAEEMACANANGAKHCSPRF